MTGGNDKAPLQQELNQKPVEVVIGLGANLGDPKAMLEAVLEELKNIPQTRACLRQPLLPHGARGIVRPRLCERRRGLQHAACARSVSRCAASALKTSTAACGLRASVNAPRTLDLDVLLWGEAVIQTPRLTVPHPRMHLRAFVLRPLLDVLPACVIPGLGRADAVARQNHGSANRSAVAPARRSWQAFKTFLAVLCGRS